MANKFFDNFTNAAEQTLYESLIIESIGIYGHDVFYLPRTTYNTDDVLNEHEYTAFRDAIQTTMYIKNVEGFEGEGVFMQKFGLEIRDQITMTVSLRQFSEDVLPFVNITRPREGDLIYLPMLKAAYQIKYVETASLFYQLGDIRTYDLVADLFPYSNEVFDTGEREIDNLYNELRNSELDYTILTEADDYIATEDNNPLSLEAYEQSQEADDFTDNPEIEDEADDILDWSERDPFSEGGRY